MLKKQGAGIRLYNLIFPLYMLLLLAPFLWLVMLIGNFLIDSLVFFLCCWGFKIAGAGAVWRKSIVRVFLFGFLSDMIGSFVCTLISIALAYLEINIDMYFWPGCFFSALPAVLIAGYCIYFFNNRYSFKKTDLNAEQIRKISLILAVVTAPWFTTLPYNFWASIGF